jgi:protein SCO1/2
MLSRCQQSSAAKRVFKPRRRYHGNVQISRSKLRAGSFRRISWALAIAMAAGAAAIGCHKTESATPGLGGARANEMMYPVRGTVVSSNPAAGELEIKHNAIPGLMEAMTMSYRLEDPSALSELHPGDVINATIVADRTPDGPANLRLRDIDIIAQARPDYVPKVQYHVPAPGDSVPDFKLLDQSDRTVALKQYRGKVLVMTFIYTRCPLSDYCVRMSHNFAKIDKVLAGDPKLASETHLISVSFDPKYDTPKVLKSYGEAYTGRYTKETFEHWTFAAPTVAELPRVEQYFDVGVTPANNGTLQHSLATLVIGKDGKVVAFWPTNDWTVPEVMAKVKQAAG